jgi:hypothetical protein
LPHRIDLEGPTRLCLLGFSLATLAFSEANAQELAPQPPKQRGGFFVPMVTVAETLDSNLFFTQFPESDWVTRFTLGVQTGYRSTPFTIDVQAARSADYFDRHPEFNTNRGRTLAQMAMTALPTRSLTLSMFACYLDTKTPSELNLGSGLALGRSLATRVSAAPQMEYRLGSRSTLTGAFPVAHDTLDGRISDTMTGVLGFDRRISRRDALSLRYEHRWFHFSGGPRVERSVADVVMFGWMGEVSERTILLLRAGPRYGKGEFTAEILATMKRRMNRGLLTLTYSKSQATTLGKTGALDTQSLVATIAMRLTRNIEVASGPGLYHNTLRGQHLSAMRLNLESLWHFSPWFHLGAAYSFDLQQPDFGAPGHIRRSAFTMKVVTSRPQRTPEAPTEEGN